VARSASGYCIPWRCDLKVLTILPISPTAQWCAFHWYQNNNEVGSTLLNDQNHHIGLCQDSFNIHEPPPPCLILVINPSVGSACLTDTPSYRRCLSDPWILNVSRQNKHKAHHLAAEHGINNSPRQHTCYRVHERVGSSHMHIRGRIQKFPDWVNNEINNDKHSLRSNTKGYGGKTHYTDS
jgi:hypothetical protein